MRGKSKAVVLLSGGMDSCVAAAMVRGEYELALAHAGYGQRAEARERRAFDEIADFYGVQERLAVRLGHLGEIGGSALTDERIRVPEARSEFAGNGGRGRVESGEIPVTYVPFRNAHFLAVAVSWAEVIGARAVVIGAVEQDSSGYPDCRAEFYRVFEELVRVGTKPETEITVLTPVIGMRKSEIVRKGAELGAPLDLTWSCYQEEEEACGVCESCVLRMEGFAQAGIADGVSYRARVGR